ncbi:MAG: MerR family transcriptional regulator [Opitutales bacterium]|nr:MerR family transcriptional regulator [Opitutales bacterium]MCH8541635.1 MerR family transcriptional regulator [Opitutales bacterium]
MKPDTSEKPSNFPVYGKETDTAYTIDVIAELADIDSKTVLRYQESGFIRPVHTSNKAAPLFDEECLRKLRHIGHLRATCGFNDTGLKLILELLHEVEILRQEQRLGPR